MRTPAPHRFEHRINDRVYRIEVSKAGTQWRARVVNAFGQATALMPFDGDTPERAADDLAVVAVAREPRRRARPLGEAGAAHRRDPAPGRPGRSRARRWPARGAACRAVGAARHRRQPDASQHGAGRAEAAREAVRHRRHHLESPGRPADGRRAARLDARARSLRAGRGRAVLERRQQPAHARAVPRALEADQRRVRRRCRARRRRRHDGHRHARGARLLPAPDRARRSSGRRRRLDAQPEHARLRGRRQPARGLPRGGRPAVARPRHAGGAQRRDQQRARRHQDRRAAACTPSSRAPSACSAWSTATASCTTGGRSSAAARAASSTCSAVTSLPRVDVFLVYQDAPGDIIKAAVDGGAKGLVIATAGAGATSGTQGEGFAYARDKQVFIVNGTRTGGGRIASRRGAAIPPAFAQRAATTVSAEDLAPVKARILLMLALTRTTSRDEIQRMFEEY